MRQAVGVPNDWMPVFAFRPVRRGRHDKKERPAVISTEAECILAEAKLEGGETFEAIRHVARALEAGTARVPNDLCRRVYMAALEEKPVRQWRRRKLFTALCKLARRLAEITPIQSIPALITATERAGYVRIVKKYFAN